MSDTKPERKTPLPAMYDWNEIGAYYEATHPGEDWRIVSRDPFRDFWHLVMDCADVRRGSEAYLEREYFRDAPGWGRSRIDWLFDNFADENCPHCVTVWMDW